jgi:hypothetical protein
MVSYLRVRAKSKTETSIDGDGCPRLPRGATWFRLPDVFTTGGATATPIRTLHFFLGAGWRERSFYFIISRRLA